MQLDSNSLEGDALTELVSMGANHAAGLLRKLVGEQVVLSVPSLEIVSLDKAATLLQEHESESLAAAWLEFQADFSGRAILIFSEAAVSALVQAIAGDELARDEIDAMADEVLTETGNIVLNGCLAAIANLLRHRLTLSIPRILRGDAAQLLEPAETGGGKSAVLFIFVNFEMKGHNIRGYIALLMDLESLAALRRLVGEFIARSTSDGN